MGAARIQRKRYIKCIYKTAMKEENKCHKTKKFRAFLSDENGQKQFPEHEKHE